MTKPPVLLIGPLPNENPKSVGGATKMFHLLVEHFQQRSYPFKVLVTNNHPSRFVNFAKIILQILFSNQNLPLVMLNISANSLVLKTFPIFLACKLRRRKLIIRIFGGGLIESFDALNPSSKYIMSKWVFMKSALVLPETKRLANHFGSHIGNMHYFPNSRVRPSYSPNGKHFQKKFLFMCRIDELKGTDHVLFVKDKLDTSYTLDIYGPIMSATYDHLNDQPYYKGSVSVDKANDVIKQYDVLLVPTHLSSEGYPGIIIEAYSLGKPVVASDWLGIPEIVDDYESGILINPFSSQDLLDAILHFNEENYHQYSDSAYKKFDMFCSERLHDDLISKFEKL